MGAQVIDRRAVLAGAAALALAPAMRAGAALADVPPPPSVPRTVRLPVSATRATDLTIWEPAAGKRPAGVALLSTGHGSWPQRYDALANVLTLNGYAVLAPLHVDSVRHPDRAAFTMQQSFGERIADLAAASAHAAKVYPGSTVIAVGHSFGTLTALCRAGALAYLGDFRDPAVTAVLGLSSPGRIPGLVRPDAYSTVSAPLMLLTGTADLVPGFVTDPADHLLAVETVRGPAFGLVMAGSDHEWVGRDPGIWSQSRLIAAFLAGYPGRDAAARRRLAHWTPASGDRFIVRNAA